MMMEKSNEEPAVERRTSAVSRRAVLAGAISLGVLPTATPRPLRRGSDVLDVLVVGGGVAGCYAATRLAESTPDSRVELHERSDRIGGRLWSVKPAGMDRQVAELGGMRIADDQTPLLGLATGPLSLEPNGKGYSLLLDCKGGAPLPECAWALQVSSDAEVEVVGALCSATVPSGLALTRRRYSRGTWQRQSR